VLSLGVSLGVSVEPVLSSAAVLGESDALESSLLHEVTPTPMVSTSAAVPSRRARGVTRMVDLLAGRG
jgi:hypothetical protein